MKIIISKLTYMKKKGFFHILGSRAINRIARFGTSIIIVRLLSKDIYGSYAYAMNILNFILLFNGLGVVHAILQFCSEKKDPKEKLPYLKYGLKFGITVNILISVLIIIFIIFFELPVKRSDELLSYLVLVPIFAVVFEIMGSYLRSTFRNKEYSYLNISNSIFYFLGTVICGYLFKVHGVITGRYFAFIFAVLIGLKFLTSELKSIKEISYPEKKEKKEFLKYSVVASFTVSLAEILYLLDIFIIGLVVREESVVASYRVATLIPFSLNFIPQAVMAFAYPYLAMNFKDKSKVKSYLYEIQKYLIILNFVISFILIMFAPSIIKVIFGSNYLDSVTPFRILAFGYFVAGSFRIPAGNVIASVRKVKINLYNGIFSGILNIILDIVLIYKFGSTGAAIATTNVIIISSLISNIYITNYLRK